MNHYDHANKYLGFTRAMSNNEGCTANCDSVGTLLFNSNDRGRIPASGQDPGLIRNRNLEVMYDMQGIEGRAGCIDTLSTSIIIESDGKITLPNLFTPNGDGNNDRSVPFEAFPGNGNSQYSTVGVRLYLKPPIYRKAGVV